jgi:O-antigen/teichoic acid export membrane protein
MNSAAPANLSSTVVRGVGLAGAGYVLSQALTFAFYLVFARLALPRDFGELAAGSILVGVGALLAESGMLAALIQRRDRFEEAASTAFVATVASGLALGLAALAAAPLVGLFFGSREIGLVAAAMAGCLLLRQLTVVPSALLQRQFSFVRRAVVEPAAVIAFGVAATAGLAAGLGVWGLVLGSYASLATDVVLSWTLARWRPQPRRASMAMWRELIAYGKHVTGAELVRRSSGETVTLALGRFVGTGALGQFQYGYRVAERPLGALVDSVSYVLFPALARISDDEERFRRGSLKALRWLGVVAFPASLVLLALGEPLVVALFGERWRPAGRAVMAMSMLTAGRSLFSLAVHMVAAAGRPQLVLQMHAVAAVALLTATVGLLEFGLIGVAAAVSLSSIVAAVYALVRAARVAGLPLGAVARQLQPPLLAALVMAAVLIALDRLVVESASRPAASALPLLGLELGVGAVVYLAALAALAPETARTIAAAAAERARGPRRAGALR